MNLYGFVGNDGVSDFDINGRIARRPGLQAVWELRAWGWIVFDCVCDTDDFGGEEYITAITRESCHKNRRLDKKMSRSNIGNAWTENEAHGWAFVLQMQVRAELQLEAREYCRNKDTVCREMEATDQRDFSSATLLKEDVPSLGIPQPPED